MARSGRFPDREDRVIFLPDRESYPGISAKLGRFVFFGTETPQKSKCAKNTKRSTETDFCALKCSIIGRYLGTLEKFLST